MTMRVLAARSGPADYVFVMLCSAIYWLRTEAGAESEWMPKSLVRQFAQAVPGAEQFLKESKVNIRAFRKYAAWIDNEGPDEDDLLVGYLLEHLKDVYAGLAGIQRNPEATDDQVTAIRLLRLWHKTENPTTLEKIRGMLTQLAVPPIMLEHFKAETKSQKPFVAELKKLVKKLTGSEGLSVPIELRETIRAKQPVYWKSYLALRREILTISKQELRDLVRANGGSMPIEDVVKDFGKRQIVHSLPKGFKGNIGETGQLQTRTGVNIDKANQIDPGSTITMNPNYTPQGDSVSGRNNNWYFKVTLTTTNAKGEKNVQYFYTDTKASQNREHKFGIVQKLLASESKIVGKWRRDLKTGDFNTQVLAAQCEITYLTCIRIGGVDAENKTGKTYGLTTLLVGSIKRRGNSLLLDYVGKDSVHQTHRIDPTTLESRKVIEILEHLCAGKKRTDLLFQEGRTVFNAPKLRTYFKTVSGMANASPHKIRHMRGTKLAIAELEEVRKDLVAKRTLTQTVVDKAFQSAMTNVGSMLGHVKGIGAGQKAVWQTAVKNYIEPSVMVEFYQDFLNRGIRLPAYLKPFATK